MTKSEAKLICIDYINNQNDISLGGFHDIDEDNFILKYSTKWEEIYITINSNKHDKDSLIKYIENNKY